MYNLLSRTPNHVNSKRDSATVIVSKHIPLFLVILFFLLRILMFLSLIRTIKTKRLITVPTIAVAIKC